MARQPKTWHINGCSEIRHQKSSPKNVSWQLKDRKKSKKCEIFYSKKLHFCKFFSFLKLFFHFLEKAFFGGRNCLKVPQEKTHLQIFEQFFKSRTESDEEIRARIEFHSRLFPKHHDECNKFIYAYPMMSVRP